MIGQGISAEQKLLRPECNARVDAHAVGHEIRLLSKIIKIPLIFRIYFTNDWIWIPQ